MLLLILFKFFIFTVSAQTDGDRKEEAKITIAISRFEIVGGKSFSEFSRKMEKDVIYAKENGAKAILFAELNSLDLFARKPKSISKEIQSLASKQNQYEKSLIRLSKKHRISIIGASTYVKLDTKEGGTKIVNRAYFVTKHGRIRSQDKLYPTPWEKRYGISSGENKVEKFNLEGASFVILICHDAEFPIISYKLKKSSPELIFVPSQTDTPYGRERVRATSRARAIENMSYVLVNGASGRSGSWHSYSGGSSFYWPQNKYFSLGGKIDLGGASTPMIVELDMEKLRKSRSDKTQIYPNRDTR